MHGTLLEKNIESFFEKHFPKEKGNLAFQTEILEEANLQLSKLMNNELLKHLEKSFGVIGLIKELKEKGLNSLLMDYVKKSPEFKKIPDPIQKDLNALQTTEETIDFKEANKKIAALFPPSEISTLFATAKELFKVHFPDRRNYLKNTQSTLEKELKSLFSDPEPIREYARKTVSSDDSLLNHRMRFFQPYLISEEALQTEIQNLSQKTKTDVVIDAILDMAGLYFGGRKIAFQTKFYIRQALPDAEGFVNAELASTLINISLFYNANFWTLCKKESEERRDPSFEKEWLINDGWAQYDSRTIPNQLHIQKNSYGTINVLKNDCFLTSINLFINTNTLDNLKYTDTLTPMNGDDSFNMIPSLLPEWNIEEEYIDLGKDVLNEDRTEQRLKAPSKSIFIQTQEEHCEKQNSKPTADHAFN